LFPPISLAHFVSGIQTFRCTLTCPFLPLLGPSLITSSSRGIFFEEMLTYFLFLAVKDLSSELVSLKLFKEPSLPLQVFFVIFHDISYRLFKLYKSPEFLDWHPQRCGLVFSDWRWPVYIFPNSTFVNNLPVCALILTPSPAYEKTNNQFFFIFLNYISPDEPFSDRSLLGCPFTWDSNPPFFSWWLRLVIALIFVNGLLPHLGH